MSFKVRDSGVTFTPHPEGQYAATCCDLLDFGMVEMTWKGQKRVKHRGRLLFWTGQEDEKGQPILVGISFTASLDEKATLRKFLVAWRGKAFTEDELKDFELENLIGVPALLQVTHNKKDDKTYVNIASIMRLPKGSEAPKPINYTRVKDRKPGEQQGGPGMPGQDEPDDDLPF